MSILIKKFIKIIFSFTLISCTSNSIDLIVFNAKIYTVNSKFDTVTSFAVNDGKFIEIGGNELVSKYKSKSTLDAKGMFIFPGFIDSHTHVLNSFLYKNKVNPSTDEKVVALKEAQSLLFKNGITTVSEVGIDPEDIQLIDSLQKINELSFRVYGMINYSPENLKYFIDKGPFETEKLTVRSFIVSLNSFGPSNTKNTKQRSFRENEIKNTIYSNEEFEKICFQIAKSGFQLNTYAINNLSNSELISSYRKVLNGISDPRWRIENANKINKSDFNLLNSKFIPSFQLENVNNVTIKNDKTYSIDGTAPPYLNKDIIDWTGRLTLGSNYPNEYINPLITFSRSLSIKKINLLSGSNHQVKNSLSRSEALRGITIWGAYSNFEELKKGSISSGNFADFVILSKDIMEIDIEFIPSSQIIATVVGGELKYRINIL